MINPGDQCNTQVFSTIDQYTGYVQSNLGNNIGFSGIYATDFATVLQEQFNRPDDRALSVTTDMWPLYKMQLNATPTLDKFAKRAIDLLPPSYSSDTDKALYDKFFTKFGTGYVSSSTAGGLIEQLSYWMTWLPQVAPMDFTQQAEIDFTETTGGWCSHPGSLDPNYASNRVTVLNCFGGDPTIPCASSDKKPSFMQDPVPLTYSFLPVSELIADADLRDAMQIATASYLKAQQAAWDNLSKCPASCDSGGSCSPPGKVCSCLPLFVGRMCSRGRGPFGAGFVAGSGECPQCVTSNALTGACSCPPGTNGLSPPVGFAALCSPIGGLRELTMDLCFAPGEPQFAGVFAVMNPGGPQCSTPNQFTGGCSCPAGSVQSGCMLAQIAPPVFPYFQLCIYFCYAKQDIPPISFGGAFQRADSGCLVGNPRTGTCSCPAPFVERALEVPLPGPPAGPGGRSQIVVCGLP